MRDLLNAVQPLVDETLLEGREVPPTPYGYWIKPDGEFVVIDGPYGHIRYLKSVSDEWTEYAPAFAKGWIRVVSSMMRHGKHVLSINLDRGVVSARAAGSMKALLRSVPFEHFLIDVGPEEGAEWKEFTDEKSFLTFFNRIRHATVAESLTEDVSVPDTDYGYWIKPDGQFVAVPPYGHERMIADDTGGAMWRYRDAFDAGWVRVVVEDGELSIQTKSGLISVRAVSSIKRLMEEKPASVYVIEMSNAYKIFSDPIMAMAFIRQHRIRIPNPVNEDIVFEDDLREAVEIPPTQYGYWIKPDGSITAVGIQQHDRVLFRMTEGQMTHYSDATRAGWLRVVAHAGGLVVNFHRGCPGARAASTLRQLAFSGRYSAFEAEAMNDGDGDWKEFSDPKNFMNFFTAARLSKTG